MAYSAPTAHRAVSSETLMLQVRFAHPPNPAPSYRFFVLFSKTHDLQVRFAHPPSAHRNLLSEGSGVPHGLFCDSAPSPIRALVFRLAYSASRNARASAAFAASIEAHRAVSSETLMLQPLRGLRTPHRSPVSSPLAAAAALWLPCVRGAVRRRAGLRGCLRIRGKGKGRPLPQSPHRTGSSSCSGVSLGLFSEKSTPYSFLQNARPSGSLRSPSEPRTVLPFLLH